MSKSTRLLHHCTSVHIFDGFFDKTWNQITSIIEITPIGKCACGRSWYGHIWKLSTSSVKSWCCMQGSNMRPQKMTMVVLLQQATTMGHLVVEACLCPNHWLIFLKYRFKTLGTISNHKPWTRTTQWQKGAWLWGFLIELASFFTIF